jgi:flagellar biosynthesis protein FlhF
MRLKTFSAKTMSAAMRLVRAEMGEDAIIVAKREDKDGTVRVTAAIEHRAPAEAAGGPYGATPLDESIEFLRRALDYHGVPMKLAIRLLDKVRGNEVEDPVLGLAAAVDDLFRFAPLPELECARPIMLVGPPGAGKTVTAAKLAARAALRGRTVNLVTTDTMRAGGTQQLAALASVLGVETCVAESPAKLFIALTDFEVGPLTLIDTAGASPFDKDALDRLGEFAAVADADLALVLPAGLDAREAAESALAFAQLRPTRLISARLDAARRLGGLLAAADAGRLHFAEAGTTSQIAQGLAALNPVAMARLLLRDPLASATSLPLSVEAAE